MYLRSAKYFNSRPHPATAIARHPSPRQAVERGIFEVAGWLLLGAFLAAGRFGFTWRGMGVVVMRGAGAEPRPG